MIFNDDDGSCTHIHLVFVKEIIITGSISALLKLTVITKIVVNWEYIKSSYRIRYVHDLCLCLSQIG